MFKILVVEDDKSAARLMQVVLAEAGYEVKVAADGKKALRMLDSEYIDLIVLDIMLPEMDGNEFLQTMRGNGVRLPVIVVSARLVAEDKYKAFISGADDYITKPVDVQELLLRIMALLRRANIANEKKLKVGKVTLDYSSLTVTREGESQTLPKKEFYLLFKLLSYPDKIFTRLQLMDEIWGMQNTSVDTTVNVHINRIRKRFASYPEFRIVAIKGVGYKAIIGSTLID